MIKSIRSPASFNNICNHIAYVKARDYYQYCKRFIFQLKPSDAEIMDMSKKHGEIAHEDAKKITTVFLVRKLLNLRQGFNGFIILQNLINMSSHGKVLGRTFFLIINHDKNLSLLFLIYFSFRVEMVKKSKQNRKRNKRGRKRERQLKA